MRKATPENDADIANLRAARQERMVRLASIAVLICGVVYFLAAVDRAIDRHNARVQDHVARIEAIEARLARIEASQ